MDKSLKSKPAIQLGEINCSAVLWLLRAARGKLIKSLNRNWLTRKTNKNNRYNLNSKGNVSDWKAYLTDMQYKFKYGAEGWSGGKTDPHLYYKNHTISEILMTGYIHYWLLTLLLDSCSQLAVNVTDTWMKHEGLVESLW